MEMVQKFGLFALAVVGVVAAIAIQVAGPAEYAIFGWVAAALFVAAGVVNRSPRWGLLASSTLGAAASGYLFWLKIRPTDGPSLCEVNKTIDCESINNSPFSVILAGSGFETPITLLGAAFFIGLAASTLWSRPQAPRLFQIASLFAIFNVAVSLYLASVLIIETKVCIFCITIYLSNLLVLWAALRGLRAEGKTLFDDLGGALSSRTLSTVTILFVVGVVIGRGLIPAEPETVTVPEGATPDQVASVLAQVDLKPLMVALDRPLELDGTEPSKGATEPRYTVVEFADYACPHCREAGKEVEAWLADQPDVQVMFKVFPLTKECNPAIPPDAESNFAPRCNAAIYAECALQQGLFWPVNHDLFENQQMLAQAGFNPDDLDVLAKNRGVDLVALKACLEDQETFRGIAMDAISGAKAGVGGTPAFFVKGVREDGGWVMANGRRGVEDMFLLIEAHRAQNPVTSAPTPAPQAVPEPSDTDVPSQVTPGDDAPVQAPE